jgi:hypothetical protein
MKNKSSFSNGCAIESLESRTLMSGTSIGIYASIPDASETAPTRAGRGEFIVKRLTGSTASAMKVHYYVRSTSTATSGVDFVPLTDTVTIPAGKRSVAISLIPIDDNIVEGDETVVAILSPTTLPVVHRTGTVTIHDNDSAQTSDWHDNTRNFRTALDINVGATARTDEPVDNTINFSQILSGLGHSGSLIDNSIHVIEVSADGSTVLDNNVPFQFDHDANFDASTQASGDLIVMLKGTTAANATRHYQVYFDTTGSFSAPTVTPLVSVDSNFTDNVGDASFKITTQKATYVMEKDNGGFSSILDNDGNDWVSFNNTSGSGGTFRGVPNLGVFGGGHPGNNYGTATLVSSGPLKTTISVVSNDGNVAFTWEFYSTFARCTITKQDEANGNPNLPMGDTHYWFLYEATPGGTFNTADTSVQSDGTVHTLDQTWDDTSGISDPTNGEWVYFNHTANNRYLFMAHNTSDSIEDSYFPLEGNMTVFGFGRSIDGNGGAQLLSAVPNTFTIGINDGGDDFSNSAATIDGIYKIVTPGTLSGAETKPA